MSALLSLSLLSLRRSNLGGAREHVFGIVSIVVAFLSACPAVPPRSSFTRIVNSSSGPRWVTPRSTHLLAAQVLPPLVELWYSSARPSKSGVECSSTIYLFLCPWKD